VRKKLGKKFETEPHHKMFAYKTKRF